MRKYLFGRGIIESTSCVTIETLKQWEYLAVPGWKQGVLTLTMNGTETGTVAMGVRYDLENGCFIRFWYTLDGKPVDYQHAIEPVACTYGGYRFYFRCRYTGKRVTALYLHDGHFASRQYHGLVYQMCADHRGPYENLHRYKHLEAKAKKLLTHGHPRRANRVSGEAWHYQMLAFRDVEGQILKTNGRIDRLSASFSTRTDTAKE